MRLNDEIREQMKRDILIKLGEKKEEARDVARCIAGFRKITDLSSMLASR